MTGIDEICADGAERIFADHFVIEKEAGRGGMGIVYRAFDRLTGRIVALKVLHKSTPSAARRFALEAEVLGKVEHPNIVRYLAHGVANDGSPYLAIEWVEGESLRDRLARVAVSGGYLDLADVVELGQRIAGGLAAAHASHIVHRDVKPSNILLVGGNLRRPKLADFGIVRASFAEHATTSGTVLGTVGYMAPEQARSAPDLDGRADLFSLGCVLFRCLTNCDVFDGPDPATVISLLLLHTPPRVSEIRPDVPTKLDRLVARLLAKDPKRRPQSASEVHEALGRIGSNLLDTTLTTARPVPLRGGQTAESGRKTKRREPESAAHHAKRRHPIFRAAIVIATTILGFGTALRPWPPLAPVATMSTAAPAGTIVTALPISSACTPVAVALYEKGMQTMHEGRWDWARTVFGEAARADESCPEAQLRWFLISGTTEPITTKRERLRAAMRFRDALSKRDRLVLDAFALLVTGEKPQHKNADELLDEAVRQFPMDAELLVLSSMEKLNLARSRKDLDSALEQTRKAAEIDPAYSDAWQLQARVLDHLGREDEGRAALEQCIKTSPGSADCMEDHVQLLRRLGQCEDAAAEAKRRTSWDPIENLGYSRLAATLAATRAPREAIEEVLRLRWERLPAELREKARLEESAKLEIWAGNFEGALRITEQLERILIGARALEAHWNAAMLSIEALVETGDAARAAHIAERALRRKYAWDRDNQIALHAAELEAWLLAAAFQGGRMTADEWRTATTAWDNEHAASLNDVERWVFRWGNAVSSSSDAAEAVARAPGGELRGRMRATLNSKRRAWLLEAYTGRIYLQADDAARAVPFLEKGARACQSLEYSSLHVRAHLWLGMAKEKVGDTEAACTAYRFVLDQWGHAKPSSVTALESERRSRALGCR